MGFCNISLQFNLTLYTGKTVKVFSNAANKVVGFIQGPGTYLLAFAIEPNRSNLIRMIDMHFAFVDYVLLSNYSE